MLTLVDLAALLLALSAVFGWINHTTIGLPGSVGQLVMGLFASVLLIGLDLLIPGQELYSGLAGILREIDFTAVVMNGMLAFLLFAGALHVDLGRLRSRAWPVAVLAVVGTALSTVIVGFATWWIAKLLGLTMPLPWALLFGALISPTDPVAVMSALKSVRIPPALDVEMKGESLFNDGVGVVLFTVILAFATGESGGETDPLGISKLLVLEVGGGILLGLVGGYIAYRAMKAIDEYGIEVLISLALVTGTYAIAQHLHLSGPLAVVTAGLLIGDRGPRYAMSDRTQTYLFALWTLIDEILNAVLFLLIGLEVLILRFEALALVLAAATIPIVLLARLAAVAFPLLLFRNRGLVSSSNVPFLTWAGIRGGISIALALSVPDGPAKPAILAATYAVVLFTIIVQGTTISYVARRTLPRS